MFCVDYNERNEVIEKKKEKGNRKISKLLMNAIEFSYFEFYSSYIYIKSGYLQNKTLSQFH